MNRFLLAIPVVLASCASSPTGSSNACQCQVAPAPGFGYTSFGASRFADTDDDGIPDTRLPDSPAAPELAAVSRANDAVRTATNPQQLDAALAELAVAVAAARTRLAAGK